MAHRTLVLTFAAVAWTAAAAVAQESDAGTERVDFARQVQPILRDRCYKCHGSKKQEGELRLDLKEFAFGADRDLWSIVPGAPDDSVLIERIRLPADDHDIMPNEGEPLTAEQIAVLVRWVGEGAAWPDEADRAVREELDRRRQREEITLRPLTADEQASEAAALAALAEAGVLAMRVAQNTTAVEVNFSLVGKSIVDADLQRLAGLEPTLVWLNLARTGISDAGVRELARFKALRRLNLSNTAIGDAALAALGELTDLEYLNLYGTKVGNAGLTGLAKLPKLEKLFVWQTAVDRAGAAALRAALPQLDVDLGEYATASPAVDPAAANPAAADPAGTTPTAATKPVNSKCPVSGQPVDPATHVEVDGRLVAFCCDKCKAKFEQDRTPFLDKIEGFEKAVKEPPPAAAVNATCPFSGRPVDLATVVEHEGRRIAFCCNNCRTKFLADPAAGLERLGK